METYTNMRICPNCAGLLEREDKSGILVCPFCGYRVKAVSNGSGEKTLEPNDGSSYDIYCINPSKEKIKVIKFVRELTGMGLKEAKDMVEGLPGLLFSNLSREKAEAIKAALDNEFKDMVVEIR